MEFEKFSIASSGTMLLGYLSKNEGGILSSCSILGSSQFKTGRRLAFGFTVFPKDSLALRKNFLCV